MAMPRIITHTLEAIIVSSGTVITGSLLSQASLKIKQSETIFTYFHENIYSLHELLNIHALHYILSIAVVPEGC